MEFDVNTLSDLAIVYGSRLVFALLIFFIGKFVAHRVVSVLRKMMRRTNVDETLIGFTGNVAYGLLIALVIIAALNKLGVETTSLAAVIAAAGLAIGLALQGSLSNLAAGVMIILFRPFKVGDYVEAGGTSGIVLEISIFTSKFRTPDNKMVVVPNNEITSGVITNYSAHDTRRVDLIFGVGYGDDLAKTKKILEEAVAADDRFLQDPEPQIAVSELADSSVNFVCRPWVHTSDYWPARFALIEDVKIRLDKAGISIPFPQRDLHIIDQAPAAAQDNAPKKKAASNKAAPKKSASK